MKQYYDLENKDIKFTKDKGLLLGDTIIPVDEYGRILINHYGPAYMVKYYSYADVIFGDLPKGTFKDKIVIIGAAATGLGDVWPTPFAHEAFPGVEKHAVVINNILQKNFIYRNNSTLLYDLLFIAVIGLGYFLPKFSPVRAPIVVVFVLILILLANYALFAYLKMWVNLVNPVLQFILVTSTVITFKFFTEDKQKRFIKGAFSQYLSPAVIENLVNNPDMLKLGGERKVLTALFSDVAGFSTISEKLSPEELVELLNNYLTEMSEIILKYGGTIDKYEGDAIIAFFGAPGI
jgi:adenylate cyclase